ncbi:hypothetical protein RI543_002929 [Arxiozyma heterogenica]|uniref:Hyphally-regulated cell wall protein N-terminal domain-containing protein n=1 Tax=Arxiozyma heterogenica TaxID=278026 RepID=A0AAN7WGB3_9SACH|nr:hypothetical protein RI543_002929 [Kazachstania heterogenica]
MQILILWSLLGLLVIRVNAATTTISTPTTLSGDQTFSDDIVIKSGATLALVSGSSYSFNGNIDVKGSLDIIGDSTNGLTSLQFGSTTTITNSGNINIENIKSAGSASDFVIAPASINNSGTFTVSQLNAAATVPGTNFTLAPTISFLNTGTIDYDTAGKGGTTNGFLYLGIITNNGSIKSGGFSDLVNEESNLVPSRFNMKGITFNNPLEGEGKVSGNEGAMILLNTDTLGDQTFDINHALYMINPNVVPSSLKIENPVGSMFVFLGVNYEKWYHEDFGTLSDNINLNFAIDGHRYWLNTSCPHSTMWKSKWFSVTPSDPLYQINGAFLYMADFHFMPFCKLISETLTRTTTITTEGFITQPTTISTVTTTTINEYTFTVTEIIYDVAVPALSTTYTTTVGSVTTPSTSTTYTTTLTDSNGSSSTEVVIVIVTPPPSTTYTTTVGSVTTPSTSTTYTTTLTDSNGSSSTEVVIVIVTPPPSTTYTTTVGSVTTPSTSTTYTTTLTDSNGSSSTEVVIVIVTPPPSTTYSSTGSSSSPVLFTTYTTIAGSVSITTTSTTYTTTLSDNNGSSSTEVVIVIVTPPSFKSFMTSSMSVSSPIYRNSSIPVEKTATTLSGTLVVLTTVVHGVTITTTYCPEPSATSEISLTATIGHSSIKSVYTNSKDEQEETSSFTTVTNVTPVTSIASTTTGPAFTNYKIQLTSRNSRESTTVVVGSTRGNIDVTSETSTVVSTVESRRLETSLTTMIPQVSQYVSEQFSSSPTAIMVPHEDVPSLVSYEGIGSIIYMRWGLTHFIGLLLFMVI